MICRIFSYNPQTKIAKVFPSNYIRDKEGLLQSAYGSQFLQSAVCSQSVEVGMDYDFTPFDKVINNEWCRYLR